jgi:hypothetical protein
LPGPYIRDAYDGSGTQRRDDIRAVRILGPFAAAQSFAAARAALRLLARKAVRPQYRLLDFAFAHDDRDSVSKDALVDLDLVDASGSRRLWSEYGRHL